MKWAARLSRCVVLKTYQTRQASTYFKKNAFELWQYWSFRFRICISNGWPFRLLEKLLSRGVKNSHGFSIFDSNRDGRPPPPNDPIFDPQNDRMFSKEAAIRAFEHIKMAEIDDKSQAYAAEQNEAEELVRVQAQLAAAIKTMQANEVRRVARIKVIVGVVLGALIILATVLFVG
jgi:hypothetical protein